MQKHVNKPTPEGKKLMEEHEVKLTNKKEEQQKSKIKWKLNRLQN